jgi:hypothetical protein
VVGFSREFEQAIFQRMTMHRLAYLGLLLCAGAFACGRTELDLGATDTLPVTTGTAGATTPTGAAGSSVTGAAGATSGTAGATSTPSGQAGATSGTAGASSTPTGQAGAPGMTGAAGGIVNPGGPNMPTTGPLIPCGTELCQPIMQACCVRAQNGVPSATCIAATETCDGGASFSCSNTPQCGGGGVCCVSAQTLSTTCEAPAACLLSPGVILCGSDADCPALLGNCCGQGNLKICRLRACAGGGGAGPGGGGPGPGGGGRGNGGGRPGG